MTDRHRRSILKGLSWRALATLTTMALVFIFTKEPLITVGVGALEVTSKLGLYYVHERAWNKMSWGKLQ